MTRKKPLESWLTSLMHEICGIDLYYYAYSIIRARPWLKCPNVWVTMICGRKQLCFIYPSLGVMK